MRSKVDAIRSLQKYVSQVLAPNPTLWAFTYGSYVWTTQRRVKDALDVPYPTWRWLKGLDRYAPELVGSPDVPQSYYLQSEIAADPVAQAAAAGVTLPTVGAVVDEFALAVQPQWEVRLEYDLGEIPADRPHARVHFVGAGGTSGPSLFYELSQPMGIECYPVPADTAKESTLNAAAVEDVLLSGFRGAGVQHGRPKRIPMWDFDGVPLDDTTTLRGASDYMKLLDFSTRQLPDVADDRRVAVVCDLRVSWRTDVDLTTLKSRQATPVRGTRIVESVTVETELT